MQKNINKQLIIENKIAYSLLILGKIDEPAADTLLKDSTNLVFTKNKQNQEFSLSHDMNATFDSEIDVQSLLVEYISEGKKVIKYVIDGEPYLMTIITNTTSEQKADSIIVTLISTQGIYKLTYKFIAVLIGTAGILSLLSMIVSRILSKKITEPILKVINVTKQYEKRNFDVQYLAKTGDEVEELSVAVNEMAKSLQEYNNEKEKLFRMISHEIKTPLTVIYGYAEGLKNGVYEDFEKPLSVIMEETMRIKSMTEDYIYLSKLESKIEKFTFKESDISKIVENAILNFESVAILKDIDIIYVPVKITNIEVDEDKLYRALINLISNCIKYTKDTIEVITSENESEVTIVIKDNGAGLSDEAFDDFKNGLTSEKSNGNGVGMFITDELIRMQKGSFHIDNNIEGGAIFTIILKK
jgi:signal transduction histidine kinase